MLYFDIKSCSLTALHYPFGSFQGTLWHVFEPRFNSQIWMTKYEFRINVSWLLTPSLPKGLTISIQDDPKSLGDSGWSLVTPVLLVLDWNSPCSTSHLCNDLIYTLVDSTGEKRSKFSEMGMDEMCKVYQWIWWVSEYQICWNFSTSQDHKPISQDLLLWPPDASDIFPHCPSFPAPKARMKTIGQTVLQSPNWF